MSDPRSRPPGRSILAVLSSDLLLQILDRLPEPRDRKSLRLTCRDFLSLDCAHRRSLSVRRRESLGPLIRRHVSLESLDLSRCPRVDARAMLEAFSGGPRRTATTLKSVDLSRSCAIRWWGLEVLVGACPGLEGVELGHCCEVGDREMAVLAGVRGLRRLGVTKCLAVTDVGLAKVAVGCPALEELCLKWCLQITDLGIDLLSKKCRDLRSLDISYLNKVTNKSLCSISTLEGLESLSVVGCPLIDDGGLAYLNNGNHSLKSIDVSRCENISSSGLMPVIRGHNFLQNINAGYCLPEITLPFLSKLQRLENHLSSLKLDGFHVSVSILETFGLHCKKLVEIGLSKCKGVTDEGISKLVASNRNLRVVDLTCCHLITDGALSAIAEFCKELKCLKLESCTLITEKGLYCIANCCLHVQEIDVTDCGIDDAALKCLSSCSELVELKLGHCPDITDKGLFYFGSNCKRLQSLDLYRCIGIGDEGLSYIAGGCRRLKKLNVCYCSKISDKGLNHLSSLQEISKLEMRKLVGITAKGITAIAVGCRSLVELDIKHCYSIDDRAVRALVQFSENLRQINVSYTAITDVGLYLLLGTLRCLQDAKLVHLLQVSVEGLGRALLAFGYKLKKLKLLTGLRPLLSPAVIQMVQSNGCRIRWVHKPLSIQ